MKTALDFEHKKIRVNSQKKCALAKISAHREHKKIEVTLVAADILHFNFLC